MLDIYLRWASAWYTQEFVEVFLFPKEIFELGADGQRSPFWKRGSRFRHALEALHFSRAGCTPKANIEDSSKADIDPENYMTSRIFILLSAILLAGCQSAKEISGLGPEAKTRDRAAAIFLRRSFNRRRHHSA